MSDTTSNQFSQSSNAHCCECAGVCWHIPPASFCDRHNQPSTPYRGSILTVCAHCYCGKYFETRSGAVVTHRMCCNCGNRQEVSE